MNYIKHLNAVYVKMATDSRLTPHHISLYLALFHLWNLTHFAKDFSILRAEVMQLSKIGSNNTYSKCLRQLHEYKYIEYKPSHNPLVGSTISCISFDATNDNTESKLNGEQKGALYKHKDKQGKLPKPSQAKPKDLDSVNDYFLKLIGETSVALQEAEKFFNHYEAVGWKVGGKSPMKNWKAAARNWKLNYEKFSNYQGKKASRHQIQENKNFQEPL